MTVTPRLARRSEFIQDEEPMATSWTYPCLRIIQSEGRTVYCFAVDGKDVYNFAAISRIGRNEDGTLVGYQRPEVVKHIHAIRSYIDSKGSFLPNAVVLSFLEGIQFTPSSSDHTQGSITIRLGKNAEKPGFIVDGQQRLAAIRTASREKFPIFATAFIADGEDEQRSQFVFVNNTKPLPKGLIHELLPEIEDCLPKQLASKRIPAALAVDLNLYKASPFYGLIKMPTNPNGIIAAASLQNLVYESLQHGLLRRTQGPDGVDVVKAMDLLVEYWNVVRMTFEDAWGLKPADSRLMHGAGLYAMGALMDFLSIKLPRGNYKNILRAIRPDCAWTSGYWKFPGGKTPWNAIENVPQQKVELGKHIIRLATSHLG